MYPKLTFAPPDILHFGIPERNAARSGGSAPLNDCVERVWPETIAGATTKAQAKLTARRVRVITNPTEMKVDEREARDPVTQAKFTFSNGHKKGRPPEATAL